jgi:hypothetical protein
MRPTKTLAELVEDRTFRARRDTHRERLRADTLPRSPAPWSTLRRIQRRFRQAKLEETRRRLAVEFQRAVKNGGGGRNSEMA